MRCVHLALAATILSAFVAHAQTPPAETKPHADPTYFPYSEHGILAKITNGQTIHFKCMGSGSPVVILTAGLGGWAADWRKVQPEMAKTTRVCAWDRPGFGFSSGTTETQTTAHIVSDLEAGLKAARIKGPYVAVGHSLGGYETLLFKDRNPRTVVGMVLVDPSVPDQFNRMMRAAPAFISFADKGLASQRAYIDRCLTGIRSGALKLGGKDPDGCLDYPPEYPRDLSLALATLDANPIRFEAQTSLIRNFRTDSAALVNPRRNYRDMPLIVLTSTKDQKLPANMGPVPAAEDMAAMHKEWVRAHDEIAALSTHGSNRLVPDASHYIQYDQPRVVVDAVEQVVGAARNSARR